MTKEDKRAAQLLAKYDRLRRELRQLEELLTQEANAFGRRRGHLGFTRIETMRVMLENMDRKQAA